MPDFSAFEKSTQDRTSRAAQMHRDLLLPILDANGSFRSDISREELNTTFKTASQNSVYESAGEQAPMIMGIHARALKNFIEQHGGTLPSDELLASAHQAIENFMTLGRGKPALSGVFEDAGKEMSSTEGIIMRDRMVSLILPVLLNSITPNMVTLIPGQFNQSEFFRIKRIAGSKFGDLQKGDIIDYTYNGQYAVMDQMFKAGDGDGTTTKFSFDSKTAFGTVYPLKRKRIMVLHDHNVVASDDAGSVMGAFRLGGEIVNVTGTVDYATGKVDVTFSKAPAIGVEVHIGYDVDIEKDPTLIPRIDHEMDSRTLYPHEAAIAGDSTIQAQWGLRREYGLDIDNMTLAGMRNLLAADKDRKILRQMLFYAKGVTEWCLRRAGIPHPSGALRNPQGRAVGNRHPPHAANGRRRPHRDCRRHAVRQHFPLSAQSLFHSSSRVPPFAAAALCRQDIRPVRSVLQPFPGTLHLPVLRQRPRTRPNRVCRGRCSPCHHLPPSCPHGPHVPLNAVGTLLPQPSAVRRPRIPHNPEDGPQNGSLIHRSQ